MRVLYTGFLKKKSIKKVKKLVYSLLLSIAAIGSSFASPGPKLDTAGRLSPGLFQPERECALLQICDPARGRKIPEDLRGQIEKIVKLSS
jgi:hypothetical protein